MRFVKINLFETVEKVKTKIKTFVDCDFPFIGLEHIEKETLRLIGTGNSRLLTSDKTLFITNDVLFGTLRPYFRKVYRPKFNGICSTDITVLRTKDNSIIDQTFLFYFIANPVFVKFASSFAKDQRPRVNWEEVAGRFFDIPDLAIQQKIASILSAYDDLIENNLRRIKLLEKATQLIYTEWFGKFQSTDSEDATLPSGWTTKVFGEIYGKLQSGKRPKGGIDKNLKVGIPSIGAENVIALGKYNYGTEKFITVDFYNNMNQGKIENKDILIYKDGAYIGKTTLFQDNFPYEKCCVNEHVFLLNAKDSSYQYYLFFTLYQPLYYDKMQNLNANAAQPGINQDSIKSLIILWPDGKTIKKFNYKITPIIQLIFALAKQNQKLKQARDLLLPKLMMGEIEL